MRFGLWQTQLKPQQLEKPLHAVTADNNTVAISTACASNLIVQSIKWHVQPLIMGNVLSGVDMIIGMDVLRKHKVHLNCERAIATVQQDNGRTFLRAKHVVQKTDPYLGVCTTEQLRAAGLEHLSAKQAAKELKRGAASWLTLVRPDMAEE